MGAYWSVKLVGTNVKLDKPSYYLSEGEKVTLTASEGYVLGKLQLESDNGLKMTVTESEGKQSYAFVLRTVFPGSAATTKVTITAPVTEVEQGQTVTFTQSLTNVTSSINKDTVEESDVLTLTAKDRTKFTGDIEVTFTGDKTETVTVEPKGNTATLKLASFWNESLTQISVTATAEYYTRYTEALTQATSNQTDDEITQEDTLVITATEGYYFKDGIRIKYTISGQPETTLYSLTGSKKYYNDKGTVFTLPLADVFHEGLEIVEVTTTAVVIPEPVEVPYTERIERVTSNIDTQPISSDEFTFNGKIKENTVLVLTSDEGYEFRDGITLTYERSNNLSQTHEFYPNSASDVKYFNDSNTVFTLDIAERWEWDTIRIVVNARAKQIYVDPGEDNDQTGGYTTQFANVYHVDDGILGKVSAERFSDFSGQQGVQPTDLGEYIYQVYKFPMKLDASYISEEPSTIQLGYHSLDTKSNYILRSRIKYDLGTIMVPEQYNNIYDYRDTQCLLHVPYAEPIEIETSYVVGQMVEIAYFLDLYNGTVTLEVYSDKIEGALVQRVDDIPVSYNIPFIQPKWNSVIGNIGGYVNNKVTKPYIEIVRNIPYDTATMFGKEGKEYDRLKEFEGYVEVADLDLSSTATRSEQEEIESLLAQGVIINVPQENILNTNV